MTHDLVGLRIQGETIAKDVESLLCEPFLLLQHCLEEGLDVTLVVCTKIVEGAVDSRVGTVGCFAGCVYFVGSRF